MLVEAGVRPWRVVGDAKQKIEATLKLAVSKENEPGAAAHE